MIGDLPRLMVSRISKGKDRAQLATPALEVAQDLLVSFVSLHLAEHASLQVSGNFVQVALLVELESILQLGSEVALPP